MINSCERSLLTVHVRVGWLEVNRSAIYCSWDNDDKENQILVSSDVREETLTRCIASDVERMGVCCTAGVNDVA